MDRFTVVITGTGAHHASQSTDIDALLAAFVAQLRAAGHRDAQCVLTTNGRDERIEPVTPMAQRSAQLAEIADTPVSKRAPREG